MDPLIVIRFIQYAALMLLCGASIFLEMLAPAPLRSALRLERFGPVVACIALAAGLCWFGGETAAIGNGWTDAFNPQMLASVVTDTPFGLFWIGHIVVAAALVVALVRRAPGMILVGLSTLLLASLALVGHAAMQEGSIGLLHRASDMVHLLAAGFWLGALPPLLGCIWLLRDPTHRADAMQALVRFSGLGHVAVALVLLTGAANIALTLGHVPTDLSSPYQQLLVEKIILVAAMLAIALINRYLAMPRLKTADAKAQRSLLVGTLAEIALGVAVIALVSAFGIADPV